MHVEIVPNRGSRPAVLLRESYREDKKVRKRTLGNLSSLPADQIEAIRRILKGERLAGVEELFDIDSSPAHGGVEAVLTTMRRLNFDTLIGSRRCRERDLVLGMVAARILAPESKLATTRWWNTTTLPEELGIAEATEDDLYEAMDWLLERQGRIEQRLTVRHLDEGSLVLYDISSSYFEGKTCPLAALGHNRDGKRGKLQVNYGLVTNSGGCPVAISVHPGNTGDPETLLPQVRRAREVHGINHMVLVGDRGLISQRQIDELQKDPDLDWITALRSSAIRKLVDQGSLQMGLFDKRNIFELTHPDYPEERLVACRNAELAKLRAAKRQSLLDATGKELETVRGMVERGRLRGKAAIGLRVGRVVNKYKVAKHFRLQIAASSFHFEVDANKVAAEAALDGIYVIRTSLAKAKMSAEDAVRSYKLLSNVERAFRSLKTVDLKVRPIHHRLEDRVRAHIFLCMLAYYVQWHMVEALRELLFADEDQASKQHRDPVAPSRRSPAAIQKVQNRRLEDGTEVHSLQTLLDDLKSIVRNRCRRKLAAETEASFAMTTRASAKQRRAFELLESIRP